MDDYVSQQKVQLLDSLENQVRFSQLVSVLVGEGGIGKTFLLNQLQHRMGQEVQFARIDASLAMSADQLDKTISLQLGLSWQSSDIGLEQRIKDSTSQKVVISIDNSHLLSLDCLDFILRLSQRQLAFQEPVLFILLAGENILPEMISQTDTFAAHQEMCVVLQIEPIELSETKPLVLALGHFNADIIESLCDDKKLNYFWQLSKGNPSELNYHLSRWLEQQSQTQVVEVRSEEQPSYLKASLYGLVVVVLVSILIFQDSVNEFISGDPESNNDSEELLLTDHKVDDELSADMDESLNNESSNKSRGQKKTKRSQTDFSRAKEDNSGNEKLASNELSPTSKRIDDGKPDNNDASAILTKNDSAQADVGIKEELDKQSKQEAQKELDELIKQIDNKETTEESTSKEATIGSLTQDELKVLSINSGHFALQWVGVSQLSGAENYRKNHPLKQEMLIYRRKTGNKVLYLVISGDFSSLNRANSAKNEYRKKGFKGQPWAKSIKAIHSEISSFQGSFK